MPRRPFDPFAAPGSDRTNPLSGPGITDAETVVRERTNPSAAPQPGNPSPARCKAKSARTGQQCRLWPIKGALVCGSHGGRAPQVRAAADRRLAAAEWSRSYGQPAADADPSGVVLDEIKWAAGHVAWLRERVREIEPSALIWGKDTETAKRSTEFPGVDVVHAAKANGWLALYNAERDRLTRMCKIAHDMGISERHVELAERLGAQLGDALRGLLGDLNLNPEQQLIAAEAVPRHLRAISG